MKQLNNTSDEVNSAMKDIQKATGNAGDTLNDLSGITKETNNTLKDTNNAAEEASKGIKGMALQEAGQKLMEFGSKITGVIGNLMDLTETTQEFNTLQGKLEGSAAQFGYDANMSKDLAKGVYKYTGDEMAATNVVTNLQAIKLPKNELKGMVDAAEAAWTAFGDSIPIESITESINETAQVGKVTGVLADAINWTAAEEDAFNQQLSACNSTQERAALIQDMLNGRYGESKTSFDEANQAIMDYRGSVYDTMNANAQLGEAFSPINSAINQVKSAIAEALAPVIEDIAQKFQPIIDKVKQFIQDNPQLVATIGAVVGVLGVLAAVIGPILIAGGLLVTVFGAISAPILIVIGVITALIAAGVALFLNWDTIKAKAVEVWNSIVNTVVTTCQNIWNTIQEKWNEIKAIIDLVLTYIIGVVTAKWNEIWNTITTVCQNIWNTIVTIWNTIWNTISSVCQLIWSTIQSVWSTILNTIQSIVESIRSFVVEKWNAIKQAVQDAVNAARDTVQTAFDNIREKVMSVIDEIKGAWQSFKDLVTKPITATVNFIKNAVGGNDDGKPKAIGMQRVPFDGYRAVLHQNEAVLPRREADKWREGKGNSSLTIAKIADTVIIREEADLDRFTEKLVRKINEQRIITNG